MKIFSILFFLVFFTALGFSGTQLMPSGHIKFTDGWNAIGYVSYPNTSVILYGTSMPNDKVVLNVNWYQENEIWFMDITGTIRSNWAAPDYATIPIEPVIHARVGGNNWGNGKMLVSTDPFASMSDLTTIKSCTIPVWVGGSLTNQVITLGETKLIDISPFNPGCTDYSFTASGGQVSRVGNILSITASSGSTSLSGSFKALSQDGIWSDNVPYSFIVLKSGVSPVSISFDTNNPLASIFPSDLGASNYIIKDQATNGATYNRSSTNGNWSDSSAPYGDYLVSAYDNQGNLLSTASYKIIDPVSTAPSTSNNVTANSNSSINTSSGQSVSHQVKTNLPQNGVIYQLSQSAPSWLSINSQTGHVSGTPPVGTGDYKFDVISTAYDSKTEKPVSSTQTIYGTVSDPATKPINSNIQSDVANNTQSIVNNQYQQTQVFNNMNQLLQSISNNTSGGGSTTIDLTATNNILTDIRTALTSSSTVDMTPPEDTSKTITQRQSSTNIKVDFIQNHLNKRYSQTAPIFRMEFSSIQVSEFHPFPDFVLDFNDETLLRVVFMIRTFFLGCVVIWALIKVVQIIKSFEY